MDSEVLVDTVLLKQHPEEIDALLFDLVVLAKRDGLLHEDEKKYIKDLASDLGVETALVEELLVE